MDVAGAQLTRYRMYIGGEWVEATGGVHFESDNPYTGKPWALIPRGVKWIRAAAAGFDPAQNQVELSTGERVGYDYLVVCPGLQLDWDRIEGLRDKNLDCMIEAREALRYISKRMQHVELPDEPTDQQRAEAIEQWKKWYLTVRPYDERDDLVEAARP